MTLSHNGVSATLHNHEGGSTRDIKRTFTTAAFAGVDHRRGTWRLEVKDDAAGDTEGSIALCSPAAVVVAAVVAAVVAVAAAQPTRLIPRAARVLPSRWTKRNVGFRSER